MWQGWRKGLQSCQKGLISITHLTTEPGSQCLLSLEDSYGVPLSPGGLPRRLAICHLHPPEHTNTLTPAGSPPSQQGTVEVSSQPRTEESFLPSPFSQSALSLGCPKAAGSSCWLELFITKLTPDFGAFEHSWPGDCKPTWQKSHPLSVQLCAEVSAATHQASHCPFKVNRLSSLYQQG